METLFIPYKAETQVGKGVVLVFAPHPDDEVFGCGGAILRHVAAGDPVHVIIVSDGGYPPGNDQDQEEYVRQRKRESKAASKVLGYGSPIFWDLPDRSLEYGEKMVRRVMEAISDLDADLVYAPSIYEMHPDHRVLGMVVVEAVRRGNKSLKLAMYEVGIPLRPNLLLDISDLVEKKREAMACFRSQLKVQDYDDHILALNRFRTYTLPKDVLAAEAYMVTSSEELSDDPFNIYHSEYEHQSQVGLTLDPRNNPLVTVIIRSIGRDRFLKEALDSVALQTYPNIEVLVVDAAGSGHLDMGEWCGRYPLRVCGSGEPLLRSKAANLGLKNAKGDLLIFLDDDDLFEPDHIASLVERLRSHVKCKLAYAGVRCIKQNDNGSWDDFIVFNEPYDPIRLLCTNYIPIHAALFRRELLDAGCSFDEQLDICEDWDFWIQASRVTKFLHVNKISARYRISDQASDIWLNTDVSSKATLRIIKKWEGRWTDEELIKIINHAGELYQRTRQVELLQEAYDARTKQVKQLEAAYEARGEHIAKLQEAYEARTAQVKHLEDTYRSPGKDRYISKLKKAYEERTEQARKLEEAYMARNREVCQLRKAYNEIQQQVKRLEAAFESRTKHIHQLETTYGLRGKQQEGAEEATIGRNK